VRLELIPDCLEEKRQELRNRGPIQDLWDRGPTFVWSGRTYEVSALLLAVVGLLSLEWLTRKLLRVA
jgi:hypothetical protein